MANKVAIERLAGLSVDVDSIRSHLRGYGIGDCTDRQSQYQRAIPRALEMFAKYRVTATFFLIAEEAAQFPDVVKSIVTAGHEIGCHSMTHQVPFDVRDDEARRREVVDSKKLLEDLSAGPVIGFRAPSWDTSEILRKTLSEAGYVYDASSFPSWMMIVYRLQVRRLGYAQSAQAVSFPWSQCLAISRPHQINVLPLIEIPVTTTPLLRLPYYHTLKYLVPQSIFAAVRSMARLRGTVTYTVHAADFLGLAEDNLDSRFGRHPGLKLSLRERLTRIEEELEVLTKNYSVVPFRTIAATVPPK